MRGEKRGYELDIKELRIVKFDKGRPGIKESGIGGIRGELRRGEESYTFFYKQPHFSVAPRVATGSAQNEAESCYEVANVF